MWSDSHADYGNSPLSFVERGVKDGTSPSLRYDHQGWYGTRKIRVAAADFDKAVALGCGFSYVQSGALKRVTPEFIPGKQFLVCTSLVDCKGVRAKGMTTPSPSAIESAVFQYEKWDLTFEFRSVEWDIILDDHIVHEWDRYTVVYPRPKVELLSSPNSYLYFAEGPGAPRLVGPESRPQKPVGAHELLVKWVGIPWKNVPWDYIEKGHSTANKYDITIGGKLYKAGTLTMVHPEIEPVRTQPNEDLVTDITYTFSKRGYRIDANAGYDWYGGKGTGSGGITIYTNQAWRMMSSDGVLYTPETMPNDRAVVNYTDFSLLFTVTP